VNKVFGTALLISASTYQQLSNKGSCRLVGTVQVVGKTEAIDVYEPMLPNIRYDLSLFSEAMQLFRSSRLEEAHRLFSGLAGSDPVSAAYAMRAAELLKAGYQEYSANWVLDSK
jgi:hypothetical protein